MPLQVAQFLQPRGEEEAATAESPAPLSEGIPPGGGGGAGGGGGGGGGGAGGGGVRKVEVVARFETRETMGFDFDQNTLQVRSCSPLVLMPDQSSCRCVVGAIFVFIHSAFHLRILSPFRRRDGDHFVHQVMELTEGSAAESVPHATPGMVLRWVQHADGPRQTVRQNEPEAFFALITKQERPVTLGFEHPWQVRKSLFDLLVFVSSFFCVPEVEGALGLAASRRGCGGLLVRQNPPPFPASSLPLSLLPFLIEWVS